MGSFPSIARGEKPSPVWEVCFAFFFFYCYCCSRGLAKSCSHCSSSTSALLLISLMEIASVCPLTNAHVPSLLTNTPVQCSAVPLLPPTSLLRIWKSFITLGMANNWDAVLSYYDTNSVISHLRRALISMFCQARPLRSGIKRWGGGNNKWRVGGS